MYLKNENSRVEQVLKCLYFFQQSLKNIFLIFPGVNTHACILLVNASTLLVLSRQAAVFREKFLGPLSEIRSGMAIVIDNIAKSTHSRKLIIRRETYPRDTSVRPSET